MFGFPHVPRNKNHQFKNNLLTSAIFQIKFPSSPQIISKKDFLLEKFSDKYPHLKNIRDRQGKIEMSPDGTPLLLSSAASDYGMELCSDDDCRILGVTKDSLTLTIIGKKYTNISDVLKEFENLYIPTIKNLDIMKLSRIAIRKINMIDAYGTTELLDCRSLIGEVYNGSIVSNIQIIPMDAPITRGLTSISLENSDNYNLHLNYGFVGDHPQKKNIKQFTYDVDLFNANTNICIENLIDEFKKINSEIYNIFIWGINSKIIESLSKANH